MNKDSKRIQDNKKGSSFKGGVNIVISILLWLYHSVLRSISAIILLIYLLSAFSDFFDPRSFLYLSFIGIAYHIILFVVLAWTLLLLILRHWKLALVMAIGLIITWEQITRYYPMNLFDNKPDVEALSIPGVDNEIHKIKLLTYNTCGMGQVRLSSIKEQIPVIDLIREVDADIVCLQEYAFTLSKGGHTQERIRKSLSDRYPYYDYMSNYSREAMGIALFSKYPIKKKERIDKSKKDYISSMYYEIEVAGRNIALVNNHLHSNQIKPQDRVLYDEMIEHFDKDSLQRIRSGMLRSLGIGFKARANQSNVIRTYLSETINGNDMPVLICGDMNDTPISYAYRKMRGNLLDAWQQGGFGAGTTYNQHHFWFRIDHIFHSSHFRTLDVKVLRQYEYSDHYPVVATFQLLPEAKQ